MFAARPYRITILKAPSRLTRALSTSPTSSKGAPSVPKEEDDPNKRREIRIPNSKRRELRTLLEASPGLRYPHLMNQGVFEADRITRRLPIRNDDPERVVKLVFKGPESANEETPQLEEKLKDLGGIIFAPRQSAAGADLISSSTPDPNPSTPTTTVRVALSWKDDVRDAYHGLRKHKGVNLIRINRYDAYLAFDSSDEAKAYVENESAHPKHHVHYVKNSPEKFLPDVKFPPWEQLSNPARVLQVSGTGSLPGSAWALNKLASSCEGFTGVWPVINGIGAYNNRSSILFDSPQNARKAVQNLVGKFFPYSGQRIGFAGFTEPKTHMLSSRSRSQGEQIHLAGKSDGEDREP